MTATGLTQGDLVMEPTPAYNVNKQTKKSKLKEDDRFKTAHCQPNLVSMHTIFEFPFFSDFYE